MFQQLTQLYFRHRHRLQVFPGFRRTCSKSLLQCLCIRDDNFYHIQLTAYLFLEALASVRICCDLILVELFFLLKLTKWNGKKNTRELYSKNRDFLKTIPNTHSALICLWMKKSTTGYNAIWKCYWNVIQKYLSCFRWN